MTKLENRENISRIIMKTTACTKCKIGQDWFNGNIEIEFIPNRCYPDYMQVNEYIMSNIDGKELNIEEVVDAVYQFLKSEYDPKELKVRNFITGCKSHFDVIVEK